MTCAKFSALWIPLIYGAKLMQPPLLPQCERHIKHPAQTEDGQNGEKVSAEADKVIDKPQRCRVKCSVLRRLRPITFTTYETVPFLVPMSVNGQLKVMLSENERLSACSQRRNVGYHYLNFAPFHFPILASTWLACKKTTGREAILPHAKCG